MPGALIVANQATGAGAGSPGIARRDLWQTKPVNLVVGTSGNTSIDWALLDIPPGSAASLTNASQSGGGPYADAVFVPDVVGTYRVQLVTNGGGPGNIQILVFRVRRDASGTLTKRGWALPALGEIEGESNYEGNMRAWAEIFEFIFEDLLTFTNSILLPMQFVVPGFNGVRSTQVTAAGGEAIGYITFDPSEYFAGNSEVDRKIRFQALLEVTAGVTAEIKLYNIDTADVVTDTTMTSNIASPTRKISASLDVGSSPLIPNGLQTYEVQLRISAPGSPGPGDFAICKGAHLLVSFS